MSYVSSQTDQDHRKTYGSVETTVRLVGEQTFTLSRAFAGSCQSSSGSGKQHQETEDLHCEN